MNGWASILSTIAGAAMFFSKNNADNGNGNGGGKNNTSTKTDLNPTEASYQEYKQKVEEAQAQKQANDPRNSNVYFGDPTAPYDPFYDYKKDSEYPTKTLIDNNGSHTTRIPTMRARLVAPFLLSEEVMHEDSTKGRYEVIGCNIFSEEEKNIWKTGGQERNFYQRYTDIDFPYRPYVEDGGEIKRVVNMARGNFRYVTFYVEILNPNSLYATTVKMAGIDNVKIGETRCNTVHLGSLIPKNKLMGEEELTGRYYMYDSAYKWEKPYGNIGYFAAHELRVNPIKSNGYMTPASLLEMGYRHVLCDNVANNGYQYQEWEKIYDGAGRTGWETEKGKVETTLVKEDGKGNYKSEPYVQTFLTIPPKSSRIVKITLPLASVKDSSAVYIPEEKLFKYDQYMGKVVEIHSYDGIADSDLHDCKYKFISSYAYEFYKKMHDAGIQGYVRYDFKPAPSLVNQLFSLKLTLAAEEGHYLPQNAHINQTHQEIGVEKVFELKFVPGKRPADMQNAWNYSYIEDREIPFESQDRQTQLALINKKFNFKYEQTFSEAFDASANN